MRVPTYDQPQVAPSALPDVREQLDTRGTHGEAIIQGTEQAAEGAVQLGKGLYKARQEARQKAAAVEATSAETQLESEWSKVAYGTQAEGGPAPGGLPAADKPDAFGAPAAPPGFTAVGGGGAGGSTPPPDVPSEGLLNARGMKAVQGSASSLDHLQSAREKIAASLSTPEARQMFLQSSQERMVNYHQQIERHTAQQIQVANEATLKARMATGLTAIAQSYTLAPEDEEAVQSQLASVEKSIRALAVSPEEGEAQVQAYRAHATEVRLDQLISDKNDKDAKTLFERDQDTLGVKAGHYRKIVEDLAEKEGASRTVHELLGQSRVVANGVDSELVDVAKMDAGVRAIPPEKQNDHLFAEASKARALAEDGNRAVTANHFNTALSQFNVRHSLGDIDETEANWLQAYAPQKWAAMQQEEASWAARSRRGQGKNELSREQMLLFTNAMSRVDHATPDDLKTWTADKITTDFYGYLPQEYVLKIADAANKKSKGDSPAGAGGKGLPTEAHDYVFQGLRSAGLIKPAEKSDPKSWSADSDAAYAYTEVNDALEKRYAAEVGAGKKPAPEDWRRWVSEEVRRVNVEGGGRAPLALVRSKPQYRGKSILPSDQGVPFDEENKIRDSLAARGIQNPSQDEIASIYNDHVVTVGAVNAQQTTQPFITGVADAQAKAKASVPAPSDQAPHAINTTHPISRSIFDASGIPPSPLGRAMQRREDDENAAEALRQSKARRDALKGSTDGVAVGREVRHQTKPPAGPSVSASELTKRDPLQVP